MGYERAWGHWVGQSIRSDELGAIAIVPAPRGTELVLPEGVLHWLNLELILRKEEAWKKGTISW